MKVLIDSHTFLWSTREEHRLSSRARDIMEDSTNQLCLSIATAWELALKLDKLRLLDQFEVLMSRAINELGMTILAIEMRHIIQSGRLPYHHRDPFDRILVAQAILEGIPILTGDSRIAQYPVQVLW